MSESSSATSSPDRAPVFALIVAGGSGRRMAGLGGARKQYLEIEGVPVLRRALDPFLEHPRLSRLLVVVPADDLDGAPAWLRALPVQLIGGGEERGDSVRNGLAALTGEEGLVLIHDGARPFVTRAIIDRVLDAAAAGGAIAAVRATDTIKEVDAAGRIVGTADRARLWHAQTPQGFPLRTIRDAYERARREGWQATDDASLCERYGLPVVVVDGSPDNIKITNPTDLPVARAIAAQRREVAGPTGSRPDPRIRGEG